MQGHAEPGSETADALAALARGTPPSVVETDLRAQLAEGASAILAYRASSGESLLRIRASSLSVIRAFSGQATAQIALRDEAIGQHVDAVQGEQAVWAAQHQATAGRLQTAATGIDGALVGIKEAQVGIKEAQVGIQQQTKCVHESACGIGELQRQLTVLSLLHQEQQAALMTKQEGLQAEQEALRLQQEALRVQQEALRVEQELQAREAALQGQALEVAQSGEGACTARCKRLVQAIHLAIAAAQQPAAGQPAAHAVTGAGVAGAGVAGAGVAGAAAGRGATARQATHRAVVDLAGLPGRADGLPLLPCVKQYT